jgi:mono/diheme cytochrome c family protein
MRDRYLAMPIEEVAQDPKARKMGMRIYGNNCSQCHGLDAAGALGFPNLATATGSGAAAPDMIKHTIVNGRRAAMPAWESILGKDGIAEATAYILSSEQPRRRPGKSRGRREALPDLLRGLPRPRSQGQPDAGCTEPHQWHLALRRHAGADCPYPAQSVAMVRCPPSATPWARTRFTS